MTPETLLLRQINPVYAYGKQPSYLAFRPQTKDDCLLSVDNGDMVTTKDSWERFVSHAGCHSIGVLAVTCGECAGESLPVIEDKQPYADHCSISFMGLNKKVINSKSKLLWAMAQQRDWLYQKPD
jgi:hypothetical protein